MTNLYDSWDNKTLNYDLEKYNFRDWALRTIQEVAPTVTELETMHKTLSTSDLLQAQKHVQNACSRKEFMEMFDNFVSDYVPPMINNKKFMVQRQGTLRCVVPNQTAEGRRLAFHQGIWVGNGRGLRTIWTPLTECYGSNTMQIMDLESSRKLTAKVIKEEMSLEEFEELAIEQSFPVTLSVGQSHLFCQEHIHGNVNNDTDITRVSIDMRILIEGEEYHRKLPGGYFRLPGDHSAAEEMDYTGKQVITYANWNTEFSKGIPLPMQRAVIDQYCTKHKISYVDYKGENEYCDWLPSLKTYIREKPDAIVLTSIFVLPDKKEWRDDILNYALDNGVELHFANEYLKLCEHSDLEKIQSIREFAVQSKDD